MSRASEWDIVVVGGANTDYLVRGPRLPAPGETVTGDEFQEGSGGKGANQAVAAARLGARVAFVAKVGSDDRGEALVARIAAEGVDTRHVSRDAAAPTGVALVLVGREGEKQILTAPGANLRLGVEDVRRAADSVAAARVVLMQLEVPVETVAEAVRLAREAGARVVLDPAPPAPLPDDLLSRVDVLRPNAAEAEALTGVRVQDATSARKAAELLLERGVGAVVVAAGREGNVLLWHEGERLLPRFEVESVDATGAGDAFAAALAVGIAEGRSLEEAAVLGSAAAALATTVLGAQPSLPRRDAVEALISGVGSQAGKIGAQTGR